MNIGEIESAVSSLSKEELAAFSAWYEEFIADAWDAEFEADVRAGRFDKLGAEAEEDFKAGRCTPL